MLGVKFFVDEDLKAEVVKDRRRRRRSGGGSFIPKEKKKPTGAKLVATLGMSLDVNSKSWSRYIRFMAIAGYLREMASLAPGDDGQHDSDDDDCPPRITEILPLVFPPAPGHLIDLKQLSKIPVVMMLKEYGLGPIAELAARTYTGAELEPDLVIQTAEMLKGLRKFFPDSAEAVKGTLYEDDRFAADNVCRRSAMEMITKDFRAAAGLGYVP